MAASDKIFQLSAIFLTILAGGVLLKGLEGVDTGRYSRVYLDSAEGLRYGSRRAGRYPLGR